MADLTDDDKQVILGDMIDELEAEDQPGDQPALEKIGSQWGFPALTDEKFKTKKAAKAWLADQKGGE